MRWLRAVLVVGVLTAAVYTTATVHWRAELLDRDTTYFLDWGRHPVWSPPPPPDLSRFQDQFHGRPRGGPIRVSYDPGEILVLGVLRAWPVLAFCTVLYWLEHPNARDAVLHIVQWLTISLLLSSVLCLLASCVLGGWGLLFPTGFALVGLLLGLWLGAGSYEPAEECSTGR